MPSYIVDGYCRRTSVFVSTEGLYAARKPAQGKWFELKDYANHDDFMSAVTDYTRNELNDHDTPPKFSIAMGVFDVCGLYSQSKLSPQIWDMVRLDRFDMEVFHAYLSKFGMWQGSVKETLRLMTDNFKGFYLNNRAYLDSDRNATLQGIVIAQGYYFTDH